MKFIKLLYNAMDFVSLGIWGITIFDLLFLNIDLLDSIDSLSKSLMAVLGAIYFGVSIPHKLKMQRLDRGIKEEELEKIKRKNDQEEKKEDICK